METQIAASSSSDNLQSGNSNVDLKSDLIGSSYAHAVMNCNLAVASNKGNIVEETGEMVNNDEKTTVCGGDGNEDDGSFTPVLSHSRKDRKAGKGKPEKQKFQTVNSNSDKTEKLDKPEKCDNKREGTSKESKEAPCSVDKETGDTKKVFVEAPIPKINPWQVKNAAQTITKNHDTHNGQTPKQEVNSSNKGTTSRINTRCKADLIALGDWPSLGDHNVEVMKKTVSSGQSQPYASKESNSDDADDKRKLKKGWIPLRVNKSDPQKNEHSKRKNHLLDDCQSSLRNVKETKSENSNNGYNNIRQEDDKVSGSGHSVANNSRGRAKNRNHKVPFSRNSKMASDLGTSGNEYYFCWLKINSAQEMKKPFQLQCLIIKNILLK